MLRARPIQRYPQLLRLARRCPQLLPGAYHAFHKLSGLTVHKRCSLASMSLEKRQGDEIMAEPSSDTDVADTSDRLTANDWKRISASVNGAAAKLMRNGNGKGNLSEDEGENAGPVLGDSKEQ